MCLSLDTGRGPLVLASEICRDLAILGSSGTFLGIDVQQECPGRDSRSPDSNSNQKDKRAWEQPWRIQTLVSALPASDPRCLSGSLAALTGRRRPYLLPGPGRLCRQPVHLTVWGLSRRCLAHLVQSQAPGSLSAYLGSLGVCIGSAQELSTQERITISCV